MFEPGHLREPALVTSTLEWRLEPGAHDGDRVVQRRRAAGEREHVEVVVLTRKTGRLDIARLVDAGTAGATLASFAFPPDEPLV